MSTEVWDWPSKKVLITGNSGTGKTTLLEKLVRKERARWKFVYDHKHGEFCKKFGATPCYYPEELDQALTRSGYIVFDPAKSFPGKPEAGFDFYCDFVYSVSERFKGKKSFVCDELQKLLDTRNEPDQLLKVLDMGRVYQIDCFMITNATNGIHNRVRNQITEVYAFTQGDENSVKWLKSKGFNSEELLTLEKFRYQWRNLDTGEFRADPKAPVERAPVEAGATGN